MVFLHFLVNVTFNWIRRNSNVLKENGFVNRPQIWPAFCKLVNELKPTLESFAYEKCTYEYVENKRTCDAAFIRRHTYSYVDDKLIIRMYEYLRTYIIGNTRDNYYARV